MSGLDLNHQPTHDNQGLPQDTGLWHQGDKSGPSCNVSHNTASFSDGNTSCEHCHILMPRNQSHFEQSNIPCMDCRMNANTKVHPFAYPRGQTELLGHKDGWVLQHQLSPPMDDLRANLPGIEHGICLWTREPTHVSHVNIHGPTQPMWRNIPNSVHGSPPYEASSTPKLMNGAVSPGVLAHTPEGSPRFGGHSEIDFIAAAGNFSAESIQDPNAHDVENQKPSNLEMIHSLRPPLEYSLAARGNDTLGNDRCLLLWNCDAGINYWG